MIAGHEDFLRTSGEAGQRVAASGRADAPAHGGQRSARLGSWRDIGGEPCVRSVAKGHRQGHPGNRGRNGAPAGSYPTAGGGTQEDHRPRSPLGGRAGAPDRSRTRGAIRNRRCAGPARARGPWPRELTRQKHPISHVKVAQLLHEQGYSLQGNRKTEEGDDHPDRDAQFRAHQRAGQAGLGAGHARHLGGHQEEGTGRKLRERGPAMAAGRRSPSRSRGTTFPDPDVPRAYPYGIYDLDAQHGLRERGNRPRHRGLRRGVHPGLVAARRPAPVSRSDGRLLITADGGGSNGSRLRLWKLELQKLADETGLSIAVCHFPPGTSKWNKIEHRLFSFISSNWRGEPLAGLRDDREADRRDDHGQGSESDLPPGPAQVPDRPQGDGRGNGARQSGAPQVSWRLELHHSTPVMMGTDTFISLRYLTIDGYAMSVRRSSSRSPLLPPPRRFSRRISMGGRARPPTTMRITGSSLNQAPPGQVRGAPAAESYEHRRADESHERVESRHARMVARLPSIRPREPQERG